MKVKWHDPIIATDAFTAGFFKNDHFQQHGY